MHITKHQAPSVCDPVCCRSSSFYPCDTCLPLCSHSTCGRQRRPLTRACWRGPQEYYTSGFLSLQAAIDAYTLGLPAQLEASLDARPAAGEADAAGGAAGASSGLYTAWGVVFPTAEYEHNEFYDAGARWWTNI